MKEDIVFPPENNRPLRLAVQAGLYFITDKEKSKVDENGTLHLETLNVYDHFDLEKFAELIVEECMNATRGAITGLDAFNNIKAHFGVKE